MTAREKIIIFDTTLRDGEQALRASLSHTAKLQIAKSLERLKVDYIEAGFPVSSAGDFESVAAIAREIKNARICGLARAVKGDIDACAGALKVADQFRIHTFIATSPLHRRTKLRKSFEETLEAAVAAVKYARRFTDDVEFSCEDAGRTPLDELCLFVEKAIDAGATTINIPDTVGYTLPSEFGSLISGLINRVPNMDKAILSVHCHDDLGLSVANSIMAIQNGARQIEGTMNGLGERAGNCALEEIVMILKTRPDLLSFYTDVAASEIHRTSKIVAQKCNVSVQPNKAIIGENAFAHSSGIHQDGVLKEKETYEIMTPESIGIHSNQLNMTSRSGRHVIIHRMENLGYKVGEDYDIESFYKKFCELADKKGTIYDYDLEALLWLDSPSDKFYELDYLSVTSGTGPISTATIRLITKENESVSTASIGNGPVDAMYNAVDTISGKKTQILDYKITSHGGRDAIGQVSIVALVDGKTYHGVGGSTDIVEASAFAYLDVLNAVKEAEAVKAESLKERDKAPSLS